MASSKVMASRSPSNPDLPRQPSSSPLNLHSDHSRGFGSMNMEEILRNIYSDADAFPGENNGGAGGVPQAVDGGAGGGGLLRNGSKTVDEVWRDIVNGGAPVGGSGEPAMTLEVFLAKAGAVNEEDVRVPVGATMAPPPQPVGAFGMEAAMMSPAAGVQFAPNVCVQNGMTGGGFGMDFGNAMVAMSGNTGGSGRGKRRAAVEEVPLDKATQQKQRRMIKNRESAARSRERKQAYTVELESMVTQLEEDNARLLKEEAELKKERYKQLMENLIPVVEKRRPPRVLRRLSSMEW